MSSAVLAQIQAGINDMIRYNYAMTRATCFIAFDSFQLLDVTGPCSVLGAANDLLAEKYYDIRVVSAAPGRVRANCGVELFADDICDISPKKIDSFFVVGGDPEGLQSLSRDTAIREWATRASHSARRFGSICSGSMILAAWGLIGDRRFATHWAAADEVRARWPDMNLDPQAIFVADGPLWTSAGITTGIDMMLAIVEADHGFDAARAIAQRLVLSVRRPGWQSQFSNILDAQAGRQGRYSNLVAWITQNLDGQLDVEALAIRAGESLRSFHRNFTSATGSSPAAFVARQRIDAACRMILDGQPLKQVADRVGYADVARLSAAFQRHFGMSAHAWRIVHSGPGYLASDSRGPEPISATAALSTSMLVPEPLASTMKRLA